MIEQLDRRTILQVVAGALLLPSTAPAAEIQDAVLSKQDGRLEAQPFGDLRVFLQGQTGTLTSLTFGSLELKAGQSPHAPHRHPEEEIMLITEGQGEISLEGRVTKVAPGSIMYAASNRLHGIVNTSDALLTFYYFKWLGK
jgi:mannose-6-phosphate isomerase-like protein (cupin superfamily)